MIVIPQKIPGWISCACTTMSSLDSGIGTYRVTSCLAGKYNACLKLSSIGNLFLVDWSLMLVTRGRNKFYIGILSRNLCLGFHL